MKYQRTYQRKYLYQRHMPSRIYLSDVLAAISLAVILGVFIMLAGMHYMPATLPV